MNWIILFFAGLFEVSLTFCLGKTREASGIGFYQMQKAIRDYLLTFAPEFNKS